MIVALKEGQVGGAALDVYEKEPPMPDNPLFGMENVLVTPHFASCTDEAYRREAFMAAEEALRVLRGEKPKFVANPEVIGRMAACE